MLAGSDSARLGSCNTKNVAFSFAQMLAHHTAGGCAMRAGDLFATGTLSGATRAELGCLLEITWDGAREIEAPPSPEEQQQKQQGFRRTYLEDGDVVSFTARAQGQAAGASGNVGFGVCSGRIVGST